MLVYIQGITKRGNKGIINRGSLRDFKSGQKDFKSGQELQIREREITNGGSNLKPRQGLRIGAEQSVIDFIYISPWVILEFWI